VNISLDYIVCLFLLAYSSLKCAGLLEQLTGSNVLLEESNLIRNANLNILIYLPSCSVLKLRGNFSHC